MNDILAKAKEYWKLVATRAIAHEKSAEWHRHLDAKLGGVATAFSALEGTAILVTIAASSAWMGRGTSPCHPGAGLRPYIMCIK